MISIWLYDVPLEIKKKNNPSIFNLEKKSTFYKEFLGVYIFMGGAVTLRNIHFVCREMLFMFGKKL